MVRRRSKRSKKIKKTALDPTRVSLNMGSLSFLAILIAAAVFSLFSIPEEFAQWPILVMGLLGAIIAIDNITKSEELQFMVASITIMLVSLLLTTIMIIPDAVRLFVAYLSFAFGIAGFIVALGAVLKLGWTK
jgi:hypothetical protein